MTVNLPLMASAIRFLTIEAVEAANSGHPGMPLGMADVVTTLAANHLNFSPKAPKWPNRDRLVLSAGHGSMLLYAFLMLSGYDQPTLDQIKNFRQLHSPTAGHPEYGLMPGIETTTGPLGQGLANAVGMAIAESKLRQEYTSDLIDYYIYTIVGDGCLMEGISFEAMSLAGHLKLNKLIVLYDDNKISIDGSTTLADSENIAKRCEALNWHFIEIDGHNYQDINIALTDAKASNQPTLIKCNTIIGFGAPSKAGTAACHGSPLGAIEAKETKQWLNCDWPPFEVPEAILKQWRDLGNVKAQKHTQWLKQLKAAKLDVDEFTAPNISSAVTAKLKQLALAPPHELATRKSSNKVLNAIHPLLPQLFGGSADLSSSNGTMTTTTKAYNVKHQIGNYIHYGVREHAMVAVMNGLALSGKYLPYGGTFLVFSDYARPSIRMAAMMQLKIILILTHDSIGLGEDGSTHQPIEHLTMLRATPKLQVLRPADTRETAAAWHLALKYQGPSVLSLSRQDVTPIASITNQAQQDFDNMTRGAYVALDLSNDDELEYTIYASGSELPIAAEVALKLHQLGHSVKVVSVISMEVFWQQDPSYIQSFLCNSSKKVAIEAGHSMSWHRFIGPHGRFFGVETFGLSGKGSDLYSHFGLTADHIVKQLTGN